ncbi:MAG: peroxiredoxin [Candidatus Lloydbacteria bacterium RIFCSPHIGHO2_02_FULL_54_17]|uniref:Peroxiredoxin n=1 Tax=Candidatus Lloydbacteria bacterium RIFCSPHIGHO2_02_FULL_54_17 TaxID=1798664 RepID=A0A1G2DFN5_9BACT|nr:MAG: peroxiredoxin [Candidatus Lloydbacteria bacterium RIFCSPHIGHO2_01_FULL_54_11]OGZ12445.1 MAG: peroxiredoxin [Candidatus Lloydbacteria bacterium RIFCSPHIGHO2_02_FULL_54_17]OGZ14704.1 MAG: peroxiredoxin [Candidatus Lloydbacteria bacterium RIFCSPLOWO2_01_FULL_54_18]OGZ16732.1 MAG: peroxiredoxin [Candidatus Lloydbacteria bacterium RIFCSPLOWO2_02_FULL_54_12]
MHNEEKKALAVGAELPALHLVAYDPKKDKEVTLRTEDYRGKKWLIFFFYPADFTFICPTELKEMAQRYPEIEKEGAEVLSVSTDTVFVHKAWHDHSDAIKNVQFPMVADPTGKLARLFGTYIPEGGDAGLSLRGTFIVDPDGIVKTMEIHDNSIGRNAGELVRKLKAAKFVRDNGGVQVCPASWEPGESTLKPGMDLVGKI